MQRSVLDCKPTSVAPAPVLVAGAAADRVVAAQPDRREAVSDIWLDGLLLIEDNADDAVLCRSELARALPEVRVHVASTLHEAIEIVQQRRIAVALVDLGLPDAYGLDVVRKLRAAALTLPLVVLSGFSEDVSEQALALGAQHVLSKHEMTGDALHKALRRARLLAGATQEVRYLATHDPLTGLYNAQQLRDHIAMVLARLRRQGGHCALLYMDLDGFKPVNDTYGHHAGDLVLAACGERLRAELRECDMAGRMGGDEFAIVVEDVHGQGALSQIAERILAAISRPVAIRAGRAVAVSGSVGIASYPEHGATPGGLLAAADEAMYVAKHSGAGGHAFAGGLRSARAMSRDAPDLATELRRAAERMDFALAYQPQVALGSGVTVAVEALLRFNRADGTALPAARFVHGLEDLRLMAEVGRWVIAQACREGARRLLQGQPLRMAVNLSASQIADPDLVRFTLETLDACGLPACRLELEVAERILADLRPDQLRTLSVLREHGVRVVLDDFGTGQASLWSLRELPLDGIKVDGTLVSSALGDSQARQLLAGLIELVHGLGISVTAECIEEPVQADFLRDVGCDYCQGYLFGRPVI